MEEAQERTTVVHITPPTPGTEKSMSVEAASPSPRADGIPWWRDAKSVTFLATVFAAIVPAVTFVQAYFEKQQSIEISRLTANHNVRMDYVTKALTPGLSVGERERIFDLLARIKDDPMLEAWAKAQLDAARRERATLTEERDLLAPEAARLRSQLDTLTAEVMGLKADRAPATRAELALKQNELLTISSKLNENEGHQRRIAEQIGEDVAKSTNWFAVVASEYQREDAMARARRLAETTPPYPVEIYRATDNKGDPLYAVTLGGSLTRQEALDRVRYAKQNAIASDAFAHQTPKWANYPVPLDNAPSRSQPY